MAPALHRGQSEKIPNLIFAQCWLIVTVNSMRHRLSIFSIFALAMAGYNGLAAPMPIEVLDMRNSIQLSIGRKIWTDPNNWYTNYSRLLTSFDAVSGSITNERSGILAAEASSGMFTVHSHAPSSGGIDPAILFNRGAATNEVWFRPVSSQTATLSVFISVGGILGILVRGPIV